MAHDRLWWRVAWRNLWRNRLRTLITASGLAFGYLGAVLVVGVSDGMLVELIENGTLADVGIPCEGDQIVRLVGAYTQTNQTLRAMLRTGDTGASCDSWHQSATSTRDSTLSMRIQAA